jgi:crotonobetainyl-CoA:carnitine CoA-transferase CaiB-like acyl-CoA transferase
MLMSKPLDGIVVLSLAEQYPGPYATLLMADLGAEIVMVERPKGGDPARQFPSFFAALNRNKRSVALDLKTEEGRDALKRLAARADVLLEGYRPGTMKRLGLDYETLRDLNPRLVYVSISGFGQDGPYRDRPAHDLSYQAMAGFFFRNARSGIAPPRAPDVAVGDLSSGMFAAVGVLAALVERARTGRGTYIDVSMTDGLVSWMSVFLVPIMNGEEPADIGAEPAYGTFSCADGKLLTLSIAHEDWFWQPLCKAIGLDDVAGLTHGERIAREGELQPLLASVLATRKRHEWAALFDEIGVAWGTLADLSEVVADPHFRARNLFREVASRRGREWHVAQPLKIGGEHPGPTRPAPGLGEHTTEILG